MEKKNRSTKQKKLKAKSERPAKPIEQLSTPSDIFNAPTASTAPVMSAEDYIIRFCDLMSNAYAQLWPEHIKAHKEPINATLDDIYAQIDAINLAKAQDIPIDVIRLQQAKAQEYFYDYNNIRHVLSVCLQLTLDNIPPMSAMTPDALSHGVIQGMLSFIDKIKSSIKARVLALNYKQLAQDLYHDIHIHTKGFANALPLPEVLLLESPIAVKYEDTDTIPASVKAGPFDLTPAIQGVLSGLDADAVITDTALLSDTPDPTSLVPVTDPILKNIAQMIAGHGTMPYLLDGNLILQSGKRFYKVIPTIRDDGYAYYVFVACNYNTLTGRIYELQKLLKTSAAYCYDYHDVDEYQYVPLPKDPSARREAIRVAHARAEHLLDLANHYFAPDLAEKEATYIRKLATTHYYSKPLYLSGHRLAAWVYYPVEYTYYISSKPTDAEGRRLFYEPNHINGNRADNRKENLKIELKKTNIGLRCTSRPVCYNGYSYPHLKDYCEKTGAGNYTTLSKRISALQKPGDSLDYGTRIYTLSADSRLLTVVDKAPKFLYKDENYPDLKSFAKAAKLDYTNIQRKLLREQKAGTKEFKYKTLKFLLLDNGSVQIS